MRKPDLELEEILSFKPVPAFMDHPWRLLANAAMSGLLWFGLAGVVYAVFR